MRPFLFDIVRCPYCGGRLELVESLFHVRRGDEVLDGILGCQCCIFPVVDGIPVLHLQEKATAARDRIQAGDPRGARRLMIGAEAEDDRLDRLFEGEPTTYREVVEALGPSFEGGYFLYRFSDPTYIVAEAAVRAIGQTVLAGGGRAIDLCGGSGHLTRAMLDLTPEPPVLADLFFAKLWLARRFTAPGCAPVCCDGNAPLPFARGAFAFAACIDAFMYIWTKRQFVGEMARLIDNPQAEPGAILIGHAHNERTWSPSHGQPLPPEGYAALFETLPARLYGESRLFDDVIAGGPLDLSRRSSFDELEPEPALTIVASARPGIFAPHPLAGPPRAPGVLRVNPLYDATPEGGRLRLRLRFPSEDYEQEYGACRAYLPEEVVLDEEAVKALSSGAGGGLEDLIRRRVVLNLPPRYC